MLKKQYSQRCKKIAPFLCWFEEYTISTLRLDALAGLTVAVILIPQSMAYAMLAGLPPVYGLYAATIAPMIGAMWGSLRQLATGPIAIMSLLVLTTLSTMAEPGSPEFIQLAFLLSLMVGTFYLLIGLLKMGLVMSFISHSAVKGFTAAAALIISATQIPQLLGISIGRHEFIILSVGEIVTKLHKSHLLTVIIGVGSILMMAGLKKRFPRAPGGLITIFLATAMVFLFGLDQRGVAVIGSIPGGLPSFSLPPISFDTVYRLLAPATVIALVSFAETYSVGKAISSETGQKIDVNQEFVGQGLANLVGGLFQCYPVSGSFSRTAINFSTGAKTGLSSVFSSGIVIVVLLFFTPLLSHIPKAALAALVITAVLTLFRPVEVFSLWKVNRHDGIIAIGVFILALLTKPDYALLIGVVTSLMLFLWKTMHPRILRISKDPEFRMFVNADIYNKPSCPQILHLRTDNVIYFANAEYTVDAMLQRVELHPAVPKFLLIDFAAIGFIDLTGIYELRRLRAELKKNNVDLAIMGIRRPVLEVIETSGFIKSISPRHIIPHKGEAIADLFRELDHDYCKNVCPYVLFHECKTVK